MTAVLDTQDRDTLRALGVADPANVSTFDDLDALLLETMARPDAARMLATSKSDKLKTAARELKGERERIAAELRRDAEAQADDMRLGKLARIAELTARVNLLKRALREDALHHAIATGADDKTTKRAIAAGSAGVALDDATRDEYTTELATLSAQLDGYYAEPITAADIAAGGRFFRANVWHNRSVGMLAVDALDLVQDALLLALGKPERVTAMRRRFDGTHEFTETVSVGAVYRQLPWAYRARLTEFRNAKMGGVRVYSLDELRDVSDEAGDTFARFGWADVDTLDLIDSGTFAADDLPDRDALLMARDAANAKALGEARDAIAAAAHGQTAAEQRSLLAVRMLARGRTLSETARVMGVASTTIPTVAKAAAPLISGTGATVVRFLDGANTRKSPVRGKDIPADKCGPVVVTHKRTA